MMNGSALAAYAIRSTSFVTVTSCQVNPVARGSKSVPATLAQPSSELTGQGSLNVSISKPPVPPVPPASVPPVPPCVLFASPPPPAVSLGVPPSPPSPPSLAPPSPPAPPGSSKAPLAPAISTTIDPPLPPNPLRPATCPLSPALPGAPPCPRNFFASSTQPPLTSANTAHEPASSG